MVPDLHAAVIAIEHNRKRKYLPPHIVCGSICARYHTGSNYLDSMED